MTLQKETIDVELSEERHRNKELEPLKIHVAELEARNAMLESSNSDVIDMNNKLQQDAKMKISTMVDSYKKKLSEVRHNMNISLSKEKKRGDAYKGKALEAHERVKGLS
jgi:hypothetical protein